MAIVPRNRPLPAAVVSAATADTIIVAARPEIVARDRRRARPPSGLASAQSADDLSAGKSADYEVGYKKPPKHTRFKPGTSGNKKGRPKGHKSLKTIAREVLTEKLRVRTSTGTKKMTRMEIIMRKYADQAVAGNGHAFKLVLPLYERGVPDEPSGSAAELMSPADLNEYDSAILAAFRAALLAEVEAAS